MPVKLPRQLPLRARLALLFAVAALLALPAPLHAHLKLLRSTPAAGDTLRQPPHALHLVFSERPELRFLTVRLLGAGGRELALAEPAEAIEGSEAGILVAIREQLGAGEYTVEWQAGSQDGHPVRGRFRFVLAAQAAAPAPAPGATQDSAAPAAPTNAPAAPMGPMTFPDSSRLHEGDSSGQAIEQPFGFRVARWLEFVALLLLAGVVVFRGIILRAVCDDQPFMNDAMLRARTLGLVSAAALLLASLARLYGEGLAMHGPGDPFEPTMLTEMVGATRWGIGWAVGAVGSLLALVGLALGGTPRLRGSRSAAIVTLGGTLLACVSPALTGHAAATKGALALPAVLFDAIHVIAAASWLGALAAIAIAGIPAAFATGPATRNRYVARLFAPFHTIALWCVGAVLLSGIASSWIRLGSIAELTMSNYGSVLLFKVYAFIFVGLMGAYNWKKVLPRLGGDDGATHRIRTNATIELTVGLVVLALTALLVVTNPPR